MELKRLEDWLSSLEPEGGCHDIDMQEETYQHELQLEEAGMGPVEELTGVSLSEEVVEQQFMDETAELESAGVMSPRPSPVVNLMYKMNCKYVL
jgi:hypothetical protein